MSARHSAPLILRLCPSMLDLSWRIVAGRPGAMQPGDRAEGAQPRAERGKGNIEPIFGIADYREGGGGGRGGRPRGPGAEGPQPRAERGKGNIEPIFGIADYREGGEEVPDRAPIRCPDPPPALHGRVEEH